MPRVLYQILMKNSGFMRFYWRDAILMLSHYILVFQRINIYLVGFDEPQFQNLDVQYFNVQ
jgi:hypothetical protein